MKREDKYPTTDTFVYHNENPKSRITGDCTFRAIATATGKPWEEVVMEMAELSCKTGYAINDKKGIERYMEQLGWHKWKQPRKPNGKKYTGKEFCKWLTKNPIHVNAIVANIGGHHITCIKRGGEYNNNFKVNDIWDCTGKSIGNYWTK